MRAVIAVLVFAAGCSSSLGVPRESADGVWRCYDGDLVVRGAEVLCDDEVTATSTGCSFPRGPLGCAGAFCGYAPLFCADQIDECAASGEASCAFPFDPTTGEYL